MRKIGAALARQFIVVTDDGKVVDRLGARCLVPVEVLPMAVAPVERW